MDFLTFIKSLPEQDDKGSRDFVAFVRSDQNFPATSDPERLAHYLYRRLNHRLTLAYQKLLMLYFYSKNNYKQPSDPTLLDKINLIVSLQNSDPLYRNLENWSPDFLENPKLLSHGAKMHFFGWTKSFFCEILHNDTIGLLSFISPNVSSTEDERVFALGWRCDFWTG